MLDLEAMRTQALALRNIVPGFGDGEDPYVMHVYETEDDGGYNIIELEEPDDARFTPLESRVYVADHCLFATVPLCEGELMVTEANAIATAGRRELDLIAEVERLRGESDQIRADVRLAQELLGTAFDMGRLDLYDPQGVNQAHRIIGAIVAGEEPMRPRKVQAPKPPPERIGGLRPISETPPPGQACVLVFDAEPGAPFEAMYSIGQYSDEYGWEDIHAGGAPDPAFCGWHLLGNVEEAAKAAEDAAVRRTVADIGSWHE
jgi:hypothetical protein